MTAYPPTPFPWKGVTVGQPRKARLPVDDLLPPWGGPAEAA
jgi:hypothetical protein